MNALSIISTAISTALGEACPHSSPYRVLVYLELSASDMQDSEGHPFLPIPDCPKQSSYNSCRGGG